MTGLSPAPPVAEATFGARLPLATSYATSLAEEGVVRGVIGPREVPRLWERHILNSAAAGEVIPDGSRVVDLGSGAGLPGIPIAIARPDVSMTLLEPMRRRVVWLVEMVGQLELDVSVVRGRAEDVGHDASMAPADVVLARAVGSLGRLAGWALPLLRTGGRLVALKGASVGDEVTRDGEAVRSAGGSRPRVVRCGDGMRAATVVVIDKMVESSGRRSRKDR